MKSIAKKGQLEVIAPAIITLVVAAAILVFGIMITENLMKNTDQTVTATATNENGWLNSSGYKLAGASIEGFNGPSIVRVTNSSGGVITAANYSVSGERIYNASAQDYTSVYINYTYNKGGQGYAYANKSVQGLGTFGDFWTIMILAIVITVIIGLILLAFSKHRMK